MDNRLEASKTRISRWSYEAAAVIQAGYDKVLSKLNNGLQLSSTYYAPAKLYIKHLQTSHFILIAPLLCDDHPCVTDGAMEASHRLASGRRRTKPIHPDFSTLLTDEGSGWGQGLGARSWSGGGPTRTAVSGINSEPKPVSRAPPAIGLRFWDRVEAQEEDSSMSPLLIWWASP